MNSLVDRMYYLIGFNERGVPFSEKIKELGMVFLLCGYFISTGFASSINNVFATLLLLIGIGYFAVNRSLNFPKVILQMIVIGFILSLIVFIYAIYGDNLKMLFKYQFESMRNFIILIFIASALSSLKISAQVFWKIIIASGMYTFVLAILIASEGTIRGEEWLRHPISVGNLGVLFSLLAMVAFFGVTGRFWKILAIVVFISGISVSILSQTRAGWLAFIVALLVLLWVLKTIDKRYFYTLAIATLVFIVAIVALWSKLPIESRFLQAVSDVSLYFNEGYANTSVGARLDMWYVTFHAFLEKPIWGWGAVPFYETYASFLEKGVGKYSLSPEFTHPHNDYMFALYHFGLFGFVFVMSFLLVPIIYLIKVIRYAKKTQVESYKQIMMLAFAGLIALEALLDFMMFDMAFNDNIIYVVVIVIFTIIFTIRNELKDNEIN